MPQSAAGIQSEMDVESSPVIPGKMGWSMNPSTWTWIWFAIACFVVLGFHIRMFGQIVPPAARFP